jgi:hypothetical protein
MIQFTLIIQMKKRKKYHTVRIFQKLNWTIVKWGKINTSNTQIQSLLGTGSSVNSGKVKLSTCEQNANPPLLQPSG